MQQGGQYRLDGSIPAANGQDIHVLSRHCRKGAGYTCLSDNISVDRRLILIQDVP